MCFKDTLTLFEIIKTHNKSYNIHFPKKDLLLGNTLKTEA